jgi:tetratricopeptide (TPR) repeat protein
MDFYFQGRVWVNKGVTAEYLTKARDCFERAAALDPDNLAAAHGVAQVDALMAIAWLATERAACFKSAEEILLRLVRQEPDNPKLHFTLGAVWAYTNRVPEGIAEYERALALDPNLAGAHGQIGNAKLLLGLPEEAEKHVLEALRLSPRDTAAYGWLQFIGSAKVLVGKTEEAVAWFRRSIEVNSGYAFAHIGLAVALAELGRLEEARNEVRIARDLGSHFNIRQSRESRASGYNPAYLNRREEIVELMRKAGVPEG